MAAKAISIEIGYSLTKVCEVDYKAKTHKVYRFFTIPTAEGIINDGILHVTPEYIEALNAEITKRKIKTKQVVFSITSGRIASREVTIPFVKENRIADVVNANASDYFPVDLSQYQLAYSILGTMGDPKGAQQYKLLVMAAPSALLSGYYDLAKALKLEVAAIDYAGNSVFQVAKDKHAQGTSLVIKIDERSSLVMAVRDARLAFVRNVAYGVEEAIQTIIDSKRWTEADTVQSAMEVMSMNDCVGSPEIVEVIGQLASGISRVVDYYISHNSDAAIENVYITGLGANIRGLEEVLAKELNLHVEVLRQIQGWNLEKSFRTQYYGEFVACVGAAAAPLGFKKDAEKSKGKEKAAGGKGGVNPAPIAYTVFGLGLVIAIALAAVSILRYMGLQKTNMELKAQNTELEAIIPIYNEYTATLASYNLVKTMYGQTENRNEELVEFLEELEDKMPSDVHVVSFTSTVDGVAINMNVSSKSEAAAAVEQLRSFNSLLPASVTVNSVVEEIDEEAGTISVNFSVAAIYRDVHAPDPADTVNADNTDDTAVDTDAAADTEE
ncbi:MAG: pilus assembly protein PilM [Lachnospiraceae bacterium]|nr:pilus assembly protein PilM [Lachnospiraceae bacterium]